jgi:hypothetical protein
VPLNKADALVEIERAVRDAFPAASHVAARADTSDILVKFGSIKKRLAPMRVVRTRFVKTRSRR